MTRMKTSRREMKLKGTTATTPTPTLTTMLLLRKTPTGTTI
jgi:hypothetical protein